MDSSSGDGCYYRAFNGSEARFRNSQTYLYPILIDTRAHLDEGYTTEESSFSENRADLLTRHLAAIQMSYLLGKLGYELKAAG